MLMDIVLCFTIEGFTFGFNFIYLCFVILTLSITRNEITCKTVDMHFTLYHRNRGHS
jgi:hypothetical protein